MGHLRSPESDADLDDIWYYIATRSGSVEIADRLIDSLTDRFYCWLLIPASDAGGTVCVQD